MNYIEPKFTTIKEFDKDFKILSKKYKSLPQNFDDFKRVLRVHIIDGSSFDGKEDIKRIDDLGEERCLPIFKVKKFACTSLSRNSKYSGIRIIYAYDKINSIVEFIEIYYKGDKENEDRKRIKKKYINRKNLIDSEI